MSVQSYRHSNFSSFCIQTRIIFHKQCPTPSNNCNIQIYYNSIFTLINCYRTNKIINRKKWELNQYLISNQAFSANSANFHFFPIPYIPIAAFLYARSIPIFPCFRSYKTITKKKKDHNNNKNMASSHNISPMIQHHLHIFFWLIDRKTILFLISSLEIILQNNFL